MRRIADPSEWSHPRIALLVFLTLLIALWRMPEVTAGESGAADTAPSEPRTLTASGATHEHADEEEHPLAALHPALVHFPLALTMAAAMAAGLGLVVRRAFFTNAATFSIVLAALSAVPTYFIGTEAGASMGRMSAGREAVVSTHGSWGTASLYVLLGVAALHLTSRVRESSPVLRWLSTGAIVGAALVLGYTGYLGGEVARGPDHLQAVIDWLTGVG